ncbi:RagB/SusD family nutrient uptake outer membrane protein [Fulvivirga sp.]|uniref:RagB/SusD family nutrient uptake outer membrane protein n=1 Tax=Fulvivirga sp. TaxID=1931237 RepID=UPI0032EDF2FC
MKSKYIYIITMSIAMIFSSCELDEKVDPNQPSLDGVLSGASKGQLNELVVGILARASTSMGNYYDVAGVIGRDIYRFDVSDPRWVGDLLGTGNLDNSAFYTATNFAARYNSVKTANTLITAAQNTSELTTEETNGYLAFAKTFKAFELLNVLNHQYDNGIRIDVEDPKNLGPFTSNAAESLTAIAGILTEAAADNAAAGSAFGFALTSGFAGFDTPATFGTFIKALQARVAVYRGEYNAALTFVDQSFLDETGNYDLGVYRVFANASGDRVNPLFFPLNTNGTTRLAHPDWINDAIPGDARLSKTQLRDAPITTANLTSNYDAWRYQSNTDDIAIIRNEELILIKAEALIQTDKLPEAVALIDQIRTDVAEVGPYSGAISKSALIDEMLLQRRYSLWDEGHRWIDMRRYNKLNEISTDRAGDTVIKQLPRPFNEIGVQGG